MNDLLSLGPRDIEGLMGWAFGTLDGISWMILLEESAGVSREMIGRHLGLELEEIESLIYSVTESEVDKWDQAILLLKASSTITQRVADRNWDSIEALAVTKLNSALASMKGNGDPLQMLEIATKANKAIRRTTGESGSAGRAPVGAAGVNVDLTLNSGNLGTLRLQLSPSIREQLSQPSRVIDGIAQRMDGAGESETAGLKMLTLEDTRKLVQDAQKTSDAESGNAFEVESFEELLNGIGIAE